MTLVPIYLFFFLNATATPEIYTLSLHDALPICGRRRLGQEGQLGRRARHREPAARSGRGARPGHERRVRSEEHTSELQSRFDLVCRLLLEKKKKNKRTKKNRRHNTRHLAHPY